MNIEIIHHGGREGVTGSCHELVLDAGHSVLIDCGLFQGAEVSAEGAAAHRPDIDFPVGRVRALVATHVHIDHVGRIPWLLAAGFKGPILTSEPSARLLPIVLADAFALGVTRDERLVERYLQMVQSRLKPLPYRQWQEVVATADLSCRIRLQRAGHILGSAYVECAFCAAPAASVPACSSPGIWAHRTRRSCPPRAPRGRPTSWCSRAPTATGCMKHAVFAASVCSGSSSGR